LEDLELIGKLSSRNNEFLGFKYSRLIRLLNLNSIKHYLKEIAYKNGIAVTFIQPEYTSQECNKCHNIDKNNRKTQEVFNCTSAKSHEILNKP
jgi:putative transposase